MNVGGIGNEVVQQPVRGWLRVESAAVMLLMVSLYWWSSAAWWIFLAAFFAPDLLLAAYLAGPRGPVGLQHGPLLRLPALLAAGAVAAHRNAALPYAMIWCAHVAFDRALGIRAEVSGCVCAHAFGNDRKGREQRTEQLNVAFSANQFAAVRGIAGRAGCPPTTAPPCYASPTRRRARSTAEPRFTSPSGACAQG